MSSSTKSSPVADGVAVPENIPKQQRSSTVSQHLNQELSVIIDTTGTTATSIAKKRQHIEECLLPYVQEPSDGYITFAGNVHQAHLPPIPSWNTTFRKAYTILFWIRPRLLDDTSRTKDNMETTTVNLNESTSERENSAGGNERTSSDNDDYKRILYRFSTAAEDHDGTGVCVTCSQWKAIARSDDDSSNASTTKQQQPRMLQTTLTAFALPYNNPAKLKRGGFLRGGGSASTPFSSWTQQILTLTENTWHLVGCTHIYPYLKRPVWSVCVDGALMGGGTPTELHYPVLQESTQQPQRSMEYCTILQNITAGGASLRVGPSSSSGTNDDKKSASQLAAEVAAAIHYPVVDMCMDLAAVSLYDVAISPVVQAVVAEAGPATAQQKYGYILPTLPPVANWTKGCSLAGGPKVGIPLTVHGAAIEVQKLSSRIQFGTTASTARILGMTMTSPSATASNAAITTSRIACPYRFIPGGTEAAPRVGLVQPEPPRSVYPSSEDEYPVLYVTGHCSVVHSLSEYLLHRGPSNHTNLMTSDGLNMSDSRDSHEEDDEDDIEHGLLSGNLTNGTRNWSTAWTEQQAISFAILPFFLALFPPIVETTSSPLIASRTSSSSAATNPLLRDSWMHLYSLFSDNGAYAAALIRFLSSLIRTGGARVHEEVLQNGILHVFASSLRLGLIRAAKLRVFATDASLESFLLFAAKNDEIPTGPPSASAAASSSSSTTQVCPPFIPVPIAEAVVQLLDVCCGPPALTIDELSPAMQIRRTSDLALTALFGLALDFDIWGGDVVAASIVLVAVAARYGGIGGCVTTGYVLRSQISVQHYLDQIRLLLRWESNAFIGNHVNSGGATATSNSSLTKSQALELVAVALRQLLQSILLSSLSNHRSIVQAEKDISACVAALSDCPMGSMTAHVILSAIVGVLTWCEILPIEAASSFQNRAGGSIAVGTNEEHKVEVASRLGRNLLVAQFHDVVAPVLLSRTVFSGEKSMASQKTNVQKSTESRSVYSLSWQHHWRLNLLLFSWVASIAGPEGIIASKSTGSLMLASALAGSLSGVLETSDKVVTVTLFMPSPAMALLIGATLRNEWSYKDLIADRLQVMIPLLPGMVVSLLSHSSDSSPDSVLSSKALTTLSEMLTSVIGAFHRVFGGIVHSTVRQAPKLRGEGSSDAIKAARTYVPHLLIVSMILEYQIAALSPRQDGNAAVAILRVPSNDDDSDALSPKRNGSDSWVDAAISSSTDLVGEIVLSAPDEEDLDKSSMVAFLRSCQISIISTSCGLIANAMSLGGAGATVPLWTAILSTLKESEVYASFYDSSNSNDQESSRNEPEVCAVDELAEKVQEKDSNAKKSYVSSALSHGVLCRVITLVSLKALKRDQEWDVWEYELASAMSKIMTLVEEKELISKPIELEGKESVTFGSDQIVLICALLDVLAYGRQTSGWCQLALPSINSSTGSASNRSVDLTATSKLLLPILQPCLRTLLASLEFIVGGTKIIVPISDRANDSLMSESLLGRVLPELDQTLTAAIVGLSFPTARETALSAMATLRKCVARFIVIGDDVSADLCRSLLSKVAEELRVRYQSEQHMKKAALFDAYSKEGNEHVSREAAQKSFAFERLLFGDGVLSDVTSTTEEISFNDDPNAAAMNANADFVLFHEPPADMKISTGRLGFADLQGLGAALEECKVTSLPGVDQSSQFAKTMSVLSPFLDAWDATAASDAASSELVNLFEANAEISSNTTDDAIRLRQLPILGSETAADAMSTFFEFAAAEKSRVQELVVRFLPGQRTSRRAFSERFCWARYVEVGPPGIDRLFERAIPDGNRDVRSRLPTLLCSQQFRRYLPKYLDNDYQSMDALPATDISSPRSSDSDHLRLSNVAAIEIDALTKTLLETGNLEIVDITKKAVEDEDEPEPLLPEAVGLTHEDEDGGMFSEADAIATNVERPELDPTVADTKPESVAGEEVMNTADSGSQEEVNDFPTDFVGKSHHSITTSSFSTPPDNSSSSLSLMHSAAAGMIEHHVDNCTHVKAEGNRQCSVLLTTSHLILEYDAGSDGFYEGEILARQEEAERQRRLADDLVASKEQNPEARNQQQDEKRQREIAGLRPKSIRWNLSEVSHIYLRRYRLRDSALELFVIPTGGTSYGGFGLFSPASSLFLDFGSGHEAKTRRDEAAFAIMRRSPPQAIKQWPDRSEQFLHEQLSRLTLGWVEGRITNFDYLLHLNILSGRSYNDTCQYPVFPWVLADYTSEEIPDMTNPDNFRDLRKPVGALNADRLSDFIERFNSFVDPSIPPFMYGSHYSTSAGVVLHYLVRLHPFAGLHRQLQGGHFDVADRLFSSVPRTWSMCTGSSAAEVKELTPEWYCNPSFLRNENCFKLGTTQDGEVMGDVVLPPWAKGSPEKFVEVMRAALESEICSSMLSDWIDLIFGRKQQGPEAIKAHNVFFYLTYYGTVDVASIEDEALRKATELQIAHFGQCPMQLFKRQHVRRLPRNYFNLSLYQVLSSYTQRLHEKKLAESTETGSEQAASQLSNRARLHSIFGAPLFLPFLSAPLSHWVHSNAPPPGPHSDLVSVRFAGTDRCLAVDAKGVFHYFRWAWRADELPTEVSVDGNYFDAGCFVAQRELPRFKTVPRLMYTPNTDETVAVAISKTLFANRSVLLVLSDGDGCGSMGMQLVDPAKGDVRGEVLVPQVHAAKITCIATDPIGTAAGHGGVGGELAIVGSADGNASLWRFMSSHYLPLRPRVRLHGHGGACIVAVAICSAIHVAATLSTGKCCLHSTGSGVLIRSFGPPVDAIDIADSDGVQLTTKFAATGALAISVQGFVVTVCETTIRSKSTADRTLVTLHLFTTDGVSLGSTPLESWRGIPHKMYCTPDGTTVMVCCGRGVTMHRLSACQPLLFLDEFQVTESDDFGSSLCAAWDVDLGPAINRPVVAVAACSGGALRLHALPGISAWSERHKKSGLSQTVGSALATPARRLKSAVKEGLGFGRQLAGIGRDLGREVSTDVKERGVGGFLGNVLFRKSSFNK